VDEADQYTFLASELLRETIPFVEKVYRVRPGRENRALAGLSMGGRQALVIGLNHLDQFAYVGEFSAGASALDPQQWPASVLGDTAATNERIKLLFLACGTEDSRFGAHNKADALLKAKGVRHVYFTTPGEHEPKVWRHALYEFAQKLF
jgi:enterochelin esterase-like enzyme